MPTIKTNEKQIAALNDIKAALDDAQAINEILAAKDVYVSCKEGKGRGAKESAVVLTDAAKKKVCATLLTMKEKLARDTLAKASKFDIQLSEEEQRVFSVSETSDVQEAEEQSTPDATASEAEDGDVSTNSFDHTEDAGEF